MIRVKRAQTNHFTALVLQAYVLADHVNDIVGLLNLQNCAIVKHPCHTAQIPSKNSGLAIHLTQVRPRKMQRLRAKCQNSGFAPSRHHFS
jgi:hypothetical protein